MSWQQTYSERLFTADDAVRLIGSGDTLFLAGTSTVPRELVQALIRVMKADNLRDLTLHTTLTVGAADLADPALAEHLRVNVMFISTEMRKAVQEGRVDFSPVFLSEIPTLFGPVIPVDVALLQVGAPDKHGYCSFGTEIGVNAHAARHAKRIIAEVNPNQPRTLGDSFIHVSQIDRFVAVDYPLTEFPSGEPDEVQERIGGHIAAMIEDESTLQLGIGGIPDAVLKYLKDKKDLGIYTELFGDGVIDLIEAGVITNAKKTVHPGKVSAGMVVGTRRCFDYIDDNPFFDFHPTEYINDPFRVAQNRRMVAINSAIEIDFTGQVCADSIGHKFFSGVGGQIDFVRGAARSEGGKAIIALSATAKGGEISRIVPSLKPGSGVVTTRNDVRYVVTEYGVAELAAKSVRERVLSLIAIAAPQFREELEREARELKYLPPSFTGV